MKSSNRCAFTVIFFVNVSADQSVSVEKRNVFYFYAIVQSRCNILYWKSTEYVFRAECKQSDEFINKFDYRLLIGVDEVVLIFQL